MRVPLGWLAEWVDLPGSLAELEERLTVGGLEIEEVLRAGPDLSALQVGLVVERAAHPNADRLSLCSVDVGRGEPLDIVCGAPNVAAGQKVAVALHGVVLPDGTKIKRSKIRSVVSNGMICSTRELGLGDDQDGILVLPEDATVGAPLPSALPQDDVVLDVEITPNRGDWVSMLGMAREVRALFDRELDRELDRPAGELRWPELVPEEGDREAAEDVEVAIEDRAGCHRYVARVVRGVRLAPSPPWLAERLASMGLRPINNIVDATNLVMLELGQPLHAFDLDRLKGAVRVRAASEGEKILTLDQQTRELCREDLVIADDSGAIAVAGVMGGAESEVGDETRNVLIESAHFEPSRVRRSARRLGLHSDASYRFERGIDREGQRRAADRAARLIQELAGGTVSRGAVEARGEPAPRTEEIEVEPGRVNRLLGTALSSADMIALLARLEIAAKGDEERLLCRPPTHRNDLHLSVDLVEEIARIHGYDRIQGTLPEGSFAGVSEPSERSLRERARSSLATAGLVEVMTFPAVPADDSDALGLAADDPRRRSLTILNPIQSTDPSLRTTLVPSVLRVARSNLSRQVERLAVFELSRVFRGGEDPGALPEEPLEVVALWCDAGEGGLWEREPVPVFFHAKGVAERLLDELGHPAAFSAGSDEPYLHPGASGELHAGGRRIAALGDLHPDVAARFDIAFPTALLMLDLSALVNQQAHPPLYREVSRQPRVRRDLAVLLDRDVHAGEVLEAIRSKAGAALVSAEIFDRYEGKGVADGKVSLAFRLVFQHADRTLTDAEVAKATDRVVNLLEKRFRGELR